MDELSRIKAHHTIASCESVPELKEMCRALIEMHFASKQMICTLMLEKLPNGVATYSPDI